MIDRQRPDSRARRLALLAVAAAGLAGVLLVVLADARRAELEEWVVGDPSRMPDRIRLVTRGIALAVAVPALALAVHVWRLGRRVVASERFPPPGVAVVRAVRILNGDAARRRGRVAQVLAVVLAAAALLVAAMIWRLGGMMLPSS